MLTLIAGNYGTDVDRWGNHHMMGWTDNRASAWIFGFAHIVMFILIVGVLIALIRLLWLKGNKERKNK